MRTESDRVSVGIVRPLLKLQYVQHGAPGNSFTVLLHCLQLQSAAGCGVLFEKLTALKLAFMKPECSSPYSQQPTASLPVCVCSIRCTAVCCYDISIHTRLPVPVCSVTYCYCSPTCFGHCCDLHQGVL